MGKPGYFALPPVQDIKALPRAGGLVVSRRFSLLGARRGAAPGKDEHEFSPRGAQ